MYHAHDPAVAAALAKAGTLPPNMREALNALDASAGLRRQLGDGFVNSYLKLRRAHWQEYTAHLSTWELQEYLDC
jgi:glutamine synthetase